MRKIFSIIALFVLNVTYFEALFGQQTCIDCSLACAMTMTQMQYDNIFCSCPTGSAPTDSGGLCYSSQYAGSAYCYDTENNCGGLYTLYVDNYCGCDSPWIA